jgi:hypothetical protein
MSEFVYLFRRPREPSKSPQEMQALMQKWQAWYKELEQGGHLAHLGQPLEMNGGAVVTNARGTLRDGPYAETKDIVGGYSVIVAADLAEAVALTKDHPVFEMGGMIEIRPVMNL